MAPFYHRAPERARVTTAGEAGPWVESWMDLLYLVLFVAGWFLLQAWILPRLGVPT